MHIVHLRSTLFPQTMKINWHTLKLRFFKTPLHTFFNSFNTRHNPPRSFKMFMLGKSFAKINQNFWNNVCCYTWLFFIYNIKHYDCTVFWKMNISLCDTTEIISLKRITLFTVWDWWADGRIDSTGVVRDAHRFGFYVNRSFMPMVYIY